jgi:Na+-transporting NADH:ubiquinone oxidoreductase subunit NqrF
MIELRDWEMHIYVQDRRYKSGWRKFNTYTYRKKHEQWMQEEVRDLKMGMYPPGKYNIEINPTTCQVRNLMSGELVEIAWSEVGGPCDPSTERFWSI